MSDKNLKKTKYPEKSPFRLDRAEPFKDGYGSFSFSMLLTISYLGIFASIICEFMVIMSSLSQPNGSINYTFMAGGVIAFVVCLAAAVFFTVCENKVKEKIEKKRQDLFENTKPVEGKITGINKYIRRIKHGSDVYEEALWTFNIEYFDKEKNDISAVESEKYLNDITEVLTDNTVCIYFKPDGGFELDGFKLRRSENDEKTEIPIIEKVVGEENVYTFGK